MYEYLALSENGFLFDARTGSTYSLNKTGTFLLRKMIDGVSPTGLPEILTEAFEVDSDAANRDVDQFLFRLRDLKIIESREEEE